ILGYRATDDRQAAKSAGERLRDATGRKAHREPYDGEGPGRLHEGAQTFPSSRTHFTPPSRICSSCVDKTVRYNPSGPSPLATLSKIWLAPLRSWTETTSSP